MWCENDVSWLYRLYAAMRGNRGCRLRATLRFATRKAACGSLSRREVDRCFLKLLGESGFRLRWLYHGAIRLFGSLMIPILRSVRRTRGTAMPL